MGHPQNHFPRQGRANRPLASLAGQLKHERLDSYYHNVVYLTLWYLSNLLSLREDCMNWLATLLIRYFERFKTTCLRTRTAGRSFQV